MVWETPGRAIEARCTVKSPVGPPARLARRRVAGGRRYPLAAGLLTVADFVLLDVPSVRRASRIRRYALDADTIAPLHTSLLGTPVRLSPRTDYPVGCPAAAVAEVLSRRSLLVDDPTHPRAVRPPATSYTASVLLSTRVAIALAARRATTATSPSCLSRLPMGLAQHDDSVQLIRCTPYPTRYGRTQTRASCIRT